MSIQFIKDNLLNDDSLTIIAHGCNCFNTMGAGVAKSIKQKYPIAYEIDNKTIRGDINKLGTISWAIINNKLKIANCYTQYYYGRNKINIDYNAVISCFININNNSTKDDIIGMPKIGCGLAGGNWNTVLYYINNILYNRNIKIFYL